MRAQFSDALNIAIAKRSLGAFADFSRRPGYEIDLAQVGYLFALTRQEDVQTFEASIELQGEAGVPSRLISAEEARALCPTLEGDDILAAAFSPEDGHATPEAVVQGYASAARALGVDIALECEVTDILVRGEEIHSVETTEGSIATSVVICAAGAWSAACGEMAGVNLPVSPLRRQILFTEAIPDLPPELPMTIDFATGFYFHREGPGLLLGMPDPVPHEGFEIETDDEWIPSLLEVAGRRAPVVTRAGIKGGWAGLYEMTPDHNALIGEAAGVSRFLYATGFSGHGFLQAPAVGEIVRDLYLERQPFVDVSPLSVERFATPDSLRPEFNVV